MSIYIRSIPSHQQESDVGSQRVATLNGGAAYEPPVRDGEFEASEREPRNGLDPRYHAPVPDSRLDRVDEASVTDGGSKNCNSTIYNR